MELTSKLESFSTIAGCIQKGKTPVLATGVIDSQKNHLTAEILKRFKKTAIVVTHNAVAAKEIAEDLKFLSENEVCLYPSKDIIFYNADVQSKSLTKQRLNILDALSENKEAAIIVLSVEALFDKLTPMEMFKKSILNVEVGDEISIRAVQEHLVSKGYEHSELVEGAGQFAVRGGIVDIFTPSYDYPVRIEFWGDEIDSIRFIDTITQRSMDKVETIRIIPMTELDESLKHDGGVSLFNYLPEDSIVFFDEPNKIGEHAKSVTAEYNESVQNRILKGIIQTEEAKLIFSYGDILSFSSGFKTVLYTLMTQNIKDFTIKEIVNFSVKSVAALRQRFDLLLEDLKFYVNNHYKVVIVSASQTRGQRLTEEIRQAGFSARYVHEITEIPAGTILITEGSLHKGFEYQHINLVYFTDRELYGDDKKKKKHYKKRSGQKIDSFTDLKIGDYIVHDNHGIGIYRGIEQIVTDGIGKDYLKLSYSDGGNLYVPTSQMDMIQKYIGGDSVKLKLNKLGGADWAKAKAKTRKAVEVVASELIELYAKRQEANGYAFGPDTIWQKEFEEMFPFDETEDQLNAIVDTKKDMESGRVMDRLICGDVGYGKTEVAIRAAFKAAQDGKQVAVLVPTTILAQQHYNTLVERLKDYPVTIEMLSRFRTDKQQMESLSRLEKGTADIVIGTHRLLSKDVKFKDLGLLIVDEEQRFGVNHKEKMKKFKETVDVLTLTATPIPRTLHMSLTGIRDMSILEEPPHERQPIQTYVMEYNEEFVKDAIYREISRDGQVYYLYNRVRNISEVAAKISKLVPDATIAYAHGQMSERELENIMVDFINGAIQVLVCTTIIETGLDISNANTIIIHDADYMGLSQLYQLRGRVGRSNRQAYAYLMYRRDKVLPEVAEKRLQAIREFTEFGSGFRIAMRDMEIRGAGNLFGGEQHGHMDAVGYDMYCKILAEVISEIKDEVKFDEFETSVDININANIPNFYIKDEAQKLEMYKKISLIRNIKDYYDVQEELEDRFGTIIQSVQNLLDIALLKACAHKADIAEIRHKGNDIVLYFRHDAKADVNKIMQAVSDNADKILFKAGVKPCLVYGLVHEKIGADFEVLREILKQMT